MQGEAQHREMALSKQPPESMAAWFKEFRNEHGFTSYQDNETPVTVDIALLVVTYFCVLLSVATLIATLGIRGREKWSAALRAGYAVAVGSIILVCLVSHGWQQGEVHITSPYVYRSNLPFKGSVGLRVGLHGTNVTLEGYYKGTSGKGYVYYVEEMPWADFGHESERYAHFLHRGLPEPVLKVMEFISIDDGGLRWGRSFHTAGHFANVLLWTAFAFWLVTNLLLFSVVVYGAYMCFFTGLTMVLACVSYHACQLEQPLIISFGDVDLTVSYGWSFWLSLATGCVTLVLGLTLIIFDHFAHDGVAVFFQLERLDQEEYMECDERKLSNPSSSTNLNYILDRRGTVIPPPSHERRGSIFLEPSRRPSRYNEILLKSLGLAPAPAQVFAASRTNLSRSTCSLSKMDKMSVDSDVRADPIKANPLFGVEKSTVSPSNSLEKDTDSCSDMDYVCKTSKVCSSTTKPSLATLREHRDNHANEKIYAAVPTSSGSVGQTAVLEPGMVSSLSLFQGENSSGGSNKQHKQEESPPENRSHRSSTGSDASSVSGIVLSANALPFSPSSMSSTDLSTPRGMSGSGTSTHKGSQPSTEVIVEILSRHNSQMSSSSEGTSATSSVDSGREASDESASAGGSDSCPEEAPSQYNTLVGSGLGKEVVVNIESSTL